VERAEEVGTSSTAVGTLEGAEATATAAATVVETEEMEEATATLRCSK
jgi:hypothetical protein